MFWMHSAAAELVGRRQNVFAKNRRIDSENWLFENNIDVVLEERKTL